MFYDDNGLLCVGIHIEGCMDVAGCPPKCTRLRIGSCESRLYQVEGSYVDVRSSCEIGYPVVVMRRYGSEELCLDVVHDLCSVQLGMDEKNGYVVLQEDGFYRGYVTGCVVSELNSLHSNRYIENWGDVMERGCYVRVE